MSRHPGYIEESSVFIRFPVNAHELDEEVIRKLFGQFGGLRNLIWKPDNNYAFAQYEKPKYALYVCELLHGIDFMHGKLVVKPRDNTKNALVFQQSQFSRPPRSPTKPTQYRDLTPMYFDDFDVDFYLNSEAAQEAALRDMEREKPATPEYRPPRHQMRDSFGVPRGNQRRPRR